VKGERGRGDRAQRPRPAPRAPGGQAGDQPTAVDRGGEAGGAGGSEFARARGKIERRAQPALIIAAGGFGEAGRSRLRR